MNNIESLSEKKIYFISDGDLDGIMARIVSQFYLDHTAKVIYYNEYDRALPDFDFNVAKASDLVIFTDITPPNLKFYERIHEHTPVFIFDHHQSGFDILGKHRHYEFDVTRCGAKIFYDWLTKGIRLNRVLDEMVYLTNIHDMWMDEHPDWKRAKSLHNSMPCYVNWKKVFAVGVSDTEKHLMFIDAQLMKATHVDQFYYSQKELAGIKNQETKELKAYKDVKKSMHIRKDNQNNSYIFFESKSKMGIVASRLMKEYGDKLKYIVMYSSFNEDNLKISLRSRNDNFNTTIISEKYGGGGHINASSFKFENREDLDKLKSGKMHLI